MVKISELNNKQLLGQIEKYEKILLGLFKERQKRIQTGKAKSSEVMTQREKASGKMATSTNDMTVTTSTATNELQVEKTAQKEIPANAPRPFPMGGDDSKEPTETGFKFDDEIFQQMQDGGDDDDDEGTQTGAEEVQVTTLLQLSKEQLADLKNAPSAKDKKKKK